LENGKPNQASLKAGAIVSLNMEDAPGCVFNKRWHVPNARWRMQKREVDQKQNNQK